MWSDFSKFKLSEIYVNGNQIVETDPIYEDILAFSIGYNRPISDRLRIGFGVLYVDDMLSDDNRTITLRLDSLWSAGVGIEWQWTEKRTVFANLNYMEIGDAPVTSPDIPGIGPVTGRYSDRQTIWLQAGMAFGTGGR